VEERCDKIA